MILNSGDGRCKVKKQTTPPTGLMHKRLKSHISSVGYIGKPKVSKNGALKSCFTPHLLLKIARNIAEYSNHFAGSIVLLRSLILRMTMIL